MNFRLCLALPLLVVNHVSASSHEVQAQDAASLTKTAIQDASGSAASDGKSFSSSASPSNRADSDPATTESGATRTDNSEAATEEDLSRWQYFVEIPMPIITPQDVAGQEQISVGPDLVEFFLSADVFDHAALSLEDLRIRSASGRAIPYALRILTPKSVRDVVPAQEFNRTEPEVGLHELTLDTNRSDVDHNEVVIDTSGISFRRAVVVDGSDDGKEWKRLVTGFILRFPADKEPFQRQSFTYSNSRHRYVRIQVSPDPVASDGLNVGDTFSIHDVKILRHVEVPGETVTMKLDPGTREPTRLFGMSASRWFVDLGGNNIPFSQIAVEINDVEFARDVTIETEIENTRGNMTYQSVTAGTWQRSRGDDIKPMSLDFPESRAGRLRITTTDYRNKPLSLEAITLSAAARQIVFERLPPSEFPLRLYFGNPEAEPANYDFSRNLPEKLPSKPLRMELAAAEVNPQFVPAPQPFTERFPWLVYATLSAVSAVLGIVVIGLSRTAIANHDGTNNATPGIDDPTESPQT